MSKIIKEQKEISDDKLIASILNKFEINPMQEKAFRVIQS